MSRHRRDPSNANAGSVGRDEGGRRPDEGYGARSQSGTAATTFAGRLNAAATCSSMGRNEATQHARRPQGRELKRRTRQPHKRCTMASTIDDLASQALALPPEDRAKLLEQLIASFEPKSPAQMAWLDLARTRREAVLAGTTVPVPVDLALERIQSRLK